MDPLLPAPASPPQPSRCSPALSWVSELSGEPPPAVCLHVVMCPCVLSLLTLSPRPRPSPSGPHQRWAGSLSQAETCQPSVYTCWCAVDAALRLLHPLLPACVHSSVLCLFHSCPASSPISTIVLDSVCVRQYVILIFLFLTYSPCMTDSSTSTGFFIFKIGMIIPIPS